MQGVTNGAELAWMDHEPITALRGAYPDDPQREQVVVGCSGPGCPWRSTPESYSTAGFSAHLAELGAPDYMVAYWKDWADIVEVPWGTLDRDAVARELFDFRTVMAGASAVYSELSDLSKPHTDPSYVIESAQQRARESHADELCDEAYWLNKDGKGEAARAMVELAERWSPGCYRQYLVGRVGVRALLRQRESGENRGSNVTSLRPSATMDPSTASEISLAEQ